MFMCLSVRGIQYFSHQNPHLNHCFYRGLWILPWGTKIYAPSIQHKMEYRAVHILGKTFNIYFLSVYFPKLLSNLWQCQGRSSMMWSCCWNIWSIGMALFIVVLDNQTSIWYFFNAITVVANGHVWKWNYIWSIWSVEYINYHHLNIVHMVWLTPLQWC